jgi:SAM-dependent methyltransferase
MEKTDTPPSGMDQLAAYQGFLQNMQDRVEHVPPEEFWKEEWGAEYSSLVKTGPFRKELLRWERQGKIGPVILDLGSGKKSATRHLEGEHQLIDVDYGARDENSFQTRLRLALDISEIPQMTFRVRKAIVQIAKHLGIDIHTADPKQIDTVICSEIINYIDYQAVLREVKKFIKPGGRLCILNQPDRCPPALQRIMHTQRPMFNQEIIEFLEQEGFEIEEIQYPYDSFLVDSQEIQDHFREPQRDMILILARYTGPSTERTEQCPETSPEESPQ